MIILYITNTDIHTQAGKASSDTPIKPNAKSAATRTRKDDNSDGRSPDSHKQGDPSDGTTKPLVPRSSDMSEERDPLISHPSEQFPPSTTSLDMMDMDPTTSRSPSDMAISPTAKEGLDFPFSPISMLEGLPEGLSTYSVCSSAMQLIPVSSFRRFSAYISW